MHATRFAAIVMLGLPLGGCFGVTIASQPVPDWAMSPQAQYEEPAAAAPRKHRTVRRTLPPQEVSSRGAIVTGEVSATSQDIPSSSEMVTGEVSATPQAPVKPRVQPSAKLPTQTKFVPEDVSDPTLRQTMSICRGC